MDGEEIETVSQADGSSPAATDAAAGSSAATKTSGADRASSPAAPGSTTPKSLVEALDGAKLELPEEQPATAAKTEEDKGTEESPTTENAESTEAAPDGAAGK